jgi:hypothetical protein
MKFISAFISGENILDQTPNKKWHFVGKVFKHLMYVGKDGSEASEEALEKARSFGTAASGLKQRSWNTPLEALKEAKKYNQLVTISEKYSKDEDIKDAVKKSHVKIKVQMEKTSALKDINKIVKDEKHIGQYVGEDIIEAMVKAKIRAKFDPNTSEGEMHLEGLGQLKFRAGEETMTIQLPKGFYVKDSYDACLQDLIKFGKSVSNRGGVYKGEF